MAKGMDLVGTVTGWFLGRVDKLNSNYLNNPILEGDRPFEDSSKPSTDTYLRTDDSV
jgi:hypothetical protein